MRTKNPVLLLCLLLAASAAFADDDDDDEREEHRGRREQHERAEKGGRSREAGREGRGARSSETALRATPGWAKYQAECGSCHLAFPPSMLPATSWTAMLATLDDHFGQNAELDEATRTALQTWLNANAGPTLPGAPQRITTLRWWTNEHDELAPDVYKRKAISSPANCVACHPGANEGAFGEREVRIPR